VKGCSLYTSSNLLSSHSEDVEERDILASPDFKKAFLAIVCWNAILVIVLEREMSSEPRFIRFKEEILPGRNCTFQNRGERRLQSQ